MNNRRQALKYILTDAISSVLAWSLFFIFRKLYIEPQKFGTPIDLTFTDRFYWALLFIPIFWLILHTIFGTYRIQGVYRKSRLKELGQTLFATLFGTLIIFFTLILDDEIAHYKNYYVSFLTLFGLQFGFTYFFRLLITTQTVLRIHNRILGFNTLIVGSNEKAIQLYQELESQKKSSGFKIIGFVHVNGGNGHLLKTHVKHLGHLKNIKEIISKHKIEEIIIAIETSEHNKIGKILNDTKGLNAHVQIIPDMYDILSGQVKMTSIFGAPLIEVNQEIMPQWQLMTKRVIDIFASILAMILLLPIYLFSATMVKLGSKGPIFYGQERIGIHGKPFMMYKFRSMHQNAETLGPQLSSENDRRITKFGKFMRQSRIDEIPQFWHVLTGEMSLVGPRPERQFFIDQITKEAPHYMHLQKIKPGMTSWGQVKFGYAENVHQMVERLKYDILYLENMSLFLDFKILIYTVLIVFQGRGK